MDSINNSLPERFEEIENIAKHDLDSALNKMIDLFEEASDSYYHDIVDSINIWITSRGNHNTLKYLQNKMGVEKDDYCLEMFKEWIEYIENKVKSK